MLICCADAQGAGHKVQLGGVAASQAIVRERKQARDKVGLLGLTLFIINTEILYGLWL